MAGAGAGAGAEIWSKSEPKPKINNFGSAILVFCADILIIFVTVYTVQMLQMLYSSVARINSDAVFIGLK